VDRPLESGFDLSVAKATALEAAAVWGVELGAPFAFSCVSYVAPAGRDAVVKVAWEGDEESLHEGDALELWDGDASVRLLRRSGRALRQPPRGPGRERAPDCGVRRLGPRRLPDPSVDGDPGRVPPQRAGLCGAHPRVARLDKQPSPRRHRLTSPHESAEVRCGAQTAPPAESPAVLGLTPSLQRGGHLPGSAKRGRVPRTRRPAGLGHEDRCGSGPWQVYP
jgi:hypothetical protein